MRAKVRLWYIDSVNDPDQNDSAIVPDPRSKHLSAVSQISHEKRHKNALCSDSVGLVPLSIFVSLLKQATVHYSSSLYL